MPKQVFADQLQSTRSMLAGVEAARDRGNKIGMEDQFVEEFRRLLEEVVEIDCERRALEARKLEKTEELQDKLQRMDRYYRKAKRYVKVKLPREAWVEFGFNDQR